MKKILDMVVVMSVFVSAGAGTAHAAISASALLAAYGSGSSSKTTISQQGVASSFTKVQASATKSDAAVRGVITSTKVTVLAADPVKAEASQKFIQGYQEVANRRINTVNEMAQEEYACLTARFQREQKVLMNELRSPGITPAERKVVMGELTALKERYDSDMAATREKYEKMYAQEDVYNKNNLSWSYNYSQN
ncbi:MAG: hypothetical protein WC547_03870 [Candidatus Omnitrophota bacterium]